MTGKSNTAIPAPISPERVKQWVALAKANPHIGAGLDLLAKLVIANHREKLRLQAAADLAEGVTDGND